MPPSIDPIHREADYEQLLDRILNAGSGREYFNPAPFTDEPEAAPQRSLMFLGALVHPVRSVAPWGRP